MNQLSIATFVGIVNNQQDITLVNARDLHAALEVLTAFNKWILRRIEDFGFIKDEDFIVIDPLVKNGQPQKTGLSGWFGGENKIEYHITLDMAKELCMVERSDIGRAARRYFIEMEKEHRDAVPAWALEQWAAHQAQLRAAQDLALSISHALPPLSEVLRLNALGLSKREVAKLLDCGETTVRRLVQRLGTAGFVVGVETSGQTRNDGVQAALPLSVSGAVLSTPSAGV